MSRQQLDFSTALVATVVGQAVLVASAWLLPFGSEYGWRDDYISELALGRFGWVQTVAFFVAGLGVLTLAFALRAATRGVWGSTVGPGLLAINGIALLACAVFPTDPVAEKVEPSTLTASGIVHIAAAMLGLLSAVAAMVVLTWTFARLHEWRGFVLWSALLATAGVSLLFAQTMQAPWAGLTQRLLTTVIAVWVAVTALRTRTTATRRHPVGIAAL
jgi:hypothetical protein